MDPLKPFLNQRLIFLVQFLSDSSKIISNTANDSEVGLSRHLVSVVVDKKMPHGQESLKIQNVKFDITVPPCKLYIEYLMSKL